MADLELREILLHCVYSAFGDRAAGVILRPPLSGSHVDAAQK